MEKMEPKRKVMLGKNLRWRKGSTLRESEVRKEERKDDSGSRAIKES